MTFLQFYRVYRLNPWKRELQSQTAFASDAFSRRSVGSKRSCAVRSRAFCVGKITIIANPDMEMPPGERQLVGDFDGRFLNVVRPAVRLLACCRRVLSFATILPDLRCRSSMSYYPIACERSRCVIFWLAHYREAERCIRIY